MHICKREIIHYSSLFLDTAHLQTMRCQNQLCLVYTETKYAHQVMHHPCVLLLWQYLIVGPDTTINNDVLLKRRKPKSQEGVYSVSVARSRIVFFASLHRYFLFPTVDFLFKDFFWWHLAQTSFFCFSRENRCLFFNYDVVLYYVGRRRRVHVCIARRPLQRTTRAYAQSHYALF